ncbi:MAG TPA: hypothetical protein VGO63_02295 [Candidatus Paceibacterota bacterium]|nr:hypothetical protein [Candidatus Paceibacterota bacterium]
MNNKFEDFSKKLTASIGSTTSLVIHTIFFVVIFGLRFFGVSASDILLILTTLVSLEAIYLSIFIQISVNRQGQELEEVSEDIEEIQKDVEEIQEDVEEISEDVDEIQKDVDEIQEDVEEISEEDEQERKEEHVEADKFKHIEDTLQSLLEKISELKSNKGAKK